jgi:RHS repeat-associated protein
VQGQILAQYDSGTWGYVAPDALGSVRQVLDPAGSVTLAQSYDPFGNPLSSAGAGSSVFGYTGEQVDASTGLVYLRARYYSSMTGRFLSKDPWKGDDLQPQSLNGWSYVEGNPINRIDPRGRCYGPATFLRSIPGEREICENLDLAIIIYTHPSTTLEQKEQAGAYITLWWIGHSTLVAGTAYIAYYRLPQLVQFITFGGEVADQGCPPASPPLYQPLPDQQPLPPSPTLPDATWPDQQPLLPIPTSPAEMPLPIPTPPAGVPLPIPTPPALMPPPYPSDPTQSPGPGWEWRPSSAPPGSSQGSWFNPDTRQSLHPEVDSPDHGPHYDYNYRGSHSNGWRYYPDGTLEEKP